MFKRKRHKHDYKLVNWEEIGSVVKSTDVKFTFVCNECFDVIVFIHRTTLVYEYPNSNTPVGDFLNPEKNTEKEKNQILSLIKMYEYEPIYRKDLNRTLRKLKINKVLI